MLRTFGLWSRYAVGLLPLLEGEGGGSGGGGTQTEAEKKALFERDAAQATLTRLQSELEALKKLVPSADQQKRLQELETAAAKAEEDRKTKAGEWESLKTELVTKHNTELEKMKTQIADLHATIADGEIDRAFAGAYIDKSPLFGGDDALTILPPELASAALRKFVTVEMVDGKPVLKVKDGAGKLVIDTSTGNAKAFAPALLDVINGLPTKDRILRGSGKTGSGSSGGGETTRGDKVDFANLTTEQMKDPKIIAAAKARTAAAGGISMGTAFDGVK